MALYKDALWFSGANGVVGIILCTHEMHDDHGGEGEPCAYVGAGKGEGEEDDIEYIMNWGVYFGRPQLDALMKHFGVAQ